jgi:hypothetical protein
MNIHNSVRSGTLVLGHYHPKEHAASTLRGVVRHAGNVVSCVEERRLKNDIHSFRNYNQQFRRSIVIEVYT